jgi:hypothetical protein
VSALALSSDDLTKLAKLLRMLGATDQERDVASRKIHEFVTARNADWDELLRPKPTQAVTVVQAPAGPRTWVTTVEDVLRDHYGALYPSELEFLPSLLARGMAPTEKQTAWLAKILRRTGVPGWDGTP